MVSRDGCFRACALGRSIGESYSESRLSFYRFRVVWVGRTIHSLRPPTVRLERECANLDGR